MTDQGRTDWGTAHVLAADGGHDAQMELAHLMMCAGIDGDMPFDQARTMSLMWGQMAASSGLAKHLLGYAGLVLVQITQGTDAEVGSGEYDQDYAWALAIVDAVADTGHSRAEVISIALAERVSPAIVAKASALKQQIVVQPLTEEDRREDQGFIMGMVEALRADAVGVQ